METSTTIHSPPSVEMEFPYLDPYRALSVVIRDSIIQVDILFKQTFLFPLISMCWKSNLL